MSKKPTPTQSDTGRAKTQASVLAFQLPGSGAADQAVPDWVQIFPAGPVVATNDGRAFRITDPVRLAASINAGKMPVLVDYDHRSYFEPYDGGDSLAAGWCSAVEARAGGIWAQIDWTPLAAQRIRDREFRFISPEFSVDREAGEVVALAAISLVNRPAFAMTALARSNPNQGDDDMRAIATALGLPEDADEAAILAAIGTRNTELAASRTPPADRFMPRADYDAVLARATSAETELASIRTAQRSAEVEAVIAAAVSAGKIAPASKPHYVALAETDAGFEQVKQLCASLPPVVGTVQVGGANPPGTTLSDVERHIAGSMGLTDDQYVTARASLRAADNS